MANQLPIVFNEYPSRLVQLNMTGSVGRGGNNQTMDIILVQTLLNLFTPSNGGPEARLVVDGIIGPRTIAAIEHYQRANLPIVDGRADAYGPTIQSLIRTLNAINSLPTDLPNLVKPNSDIVRCLTNRLPNRNPSLPIGGQQIRHSADVSSFGFNVRSPGLAVTAPARRAGRVGWSIISSGSFDVSVSFIGVAFINIYMNHDTEPRVTYRFTFAGSGVGLSTLPIGMDVSFASMPSWGSDIVRIASNEPDPLPNAAAFDLMPACVMSIGGNIGPGWSGTCLFLGGAPPVVPRFGGAMTGMQAGIPGGSINLYVGAIAGWM